MKLAGDHSIKQDRKAVALVLAQIAEQCPASGQFRERCETALHQVVGALLEAADNFQNMLILAGKAFLLGLPLILTLGPIRYYNRDRPHLGGGYHWPDNFQGILDDFAINPLGARYCTYVSFIILFGFLWYYALFGYSKAPLFLRRSSWMIPLFVVAHLITGKINEHA